MQIMHEAFDCRTFKFKLKLNEARIHRSRQGEHMERSPPPPEIEKNCCRKMMLFPKALFLATSLPKKIKIQFF